MRAICLVNGDPGLVMKYLAFLTFNDTHRIPKRLATISRFRDRDPTHSRASFIHHTRVDINMRTECKANIGGKSKLPPKTRQHTTIRPGTAPIERGEIPNLEAIVGQVGKELGSANQIEGIVRILGQHRLAVRQEAVMADTHVEKLRLRVVAEFDTCARSRKGVNTNLMLWLSG